jgi:hypothetical protein
VDGEGNPSGWSSVWTLLISSEPYWTQTTWSGGPTKPSLQVGKWTPSYDNFYDNENVDWSASVKLKLQPGGVYENGWFESSIYNAGSGENWGVVTWDASTPSQAFVDDNKYVSSYDNVKGTVENFENEKQVDGGYATLAESTTVGGWEAREAWPGTVGATVACYAENASAKYIYALECPTTAGRLFRYDIATDEWSASLLTWPVATATGSGMVWTGGDNIYVLAGSSTNPNPFYRYTISTNTTNNMTYAPGKANTGSGLAYDGGDNIYALLTWSSGPAASYLYAYSISSGGWTFLANAPEQMASGSNICRVGSYLYIGGGVYAAYPNRYWRWSAGGGWENLAPLPSDNWGAGGGQEKVSTTFIYATKGGSGATTNNFMRYSIPDNSWVYKEDLPGALGTANDRLAFDGTYLYLVRGATDSSFWRYLVTVTGYNMEIREDIDSIPSADNYTLQMRYRLANTYDNFHVQVWNGTAWNTRGAVLSDNNWTDWSYTLLGGENIGGKVQVRFVDDNVGSTAQDNLLIDYLRVRSQAAQWSMSLVMKLRTGSDNDPYPNDTENWSGWCVHNNNTENISMPDNRYVQYRVELSTTDNTKTPELLDITINYTMVFSLHLVAGWNLIGFPVTNADMTPNNLFAGTTYTMYYWTAPGGPYNEPSKNLPVEDNRGYWVGENQNWSVQIPI